MTFLGGGNRTEVRLLTFDVIGNIPAPGIFGRLFWATDEDLLYYDTGAAWVPLTSGGAATMQEFFPVTHLDVPADVPINKVGTYAAALIDASNERCETTGRFPHDFSSITNMLLVFIPNATDAQGMMGNLNSKNAAIGEDFNIHNSATGATNLGPVTTDRIQSFDISGMFGAASADDFFGVELVFSAISGDNIATDIYVLGVVLRYS